MRLGFLLLLLDAVSAFPELISKSKNQHHFKMMRLLAW
jgi:hypothetical protein